MAISCRIERTERTIFQLLLLQMKVVFEVPKIGFKICLTFLLQTSGIFPVYVKLQVWLYKAYGEPFFIVRIKIFINPFSTNAPLLCSQKL